MSVNVKRKVVIIGYICTHLFYIVVSLIVYGAYFTDNIALYKVVNDKQHGNGTIMIKEEVMGYFKRVETSRCVEVNSAIKSCKTSTKGNPSEMEFIVTTLVLLLSFYISSMVGMAYILCRTTRTRKAIFRVLLACVVVIYILFVIAHVLYAELAGEADGFTWVHLSAIFYVGFVNALFTPFISVVFILLAHNRGENLIKKAGLIYARYDSSNQEASEKNDQIQTERDPQNVTISVQSPTVYQKESMDICASKIQQMVKQIWRPEMIGYGHDSKGLRHTTIDVINTKPIGNDTAYHPYLKKKMEVEGCVSKCGCKLTSPSEFPKTKSVLTETFVKNNSCLRKLLNGKVNEFYLFHGIPADHLDSIEREGLDFEKYRYSMFGKGVYFSEDPVKADQYTGKRRESTSELCCILVCRVVLGAFVIVKQNHTISTKTQSAPCKTCLKPDPDCTCKDSVKFDSVIYEGITFREFIIYDTSYCFPEFAILYKRVS